MLQLPVKNIITQFQKHPECNNAFNSVYNKIIQIIVEDFIISPPFIDEEDTHDYEIDQPDYTTEEIQYYVEEQIDHITFVVRKIVNDFQRQGQSQDLYHIHPIVCRNYLYIS